QEEATITNNPVVAGDGDSGEEDVAIEEGFVDLPPLESQRTGVASSSHVRGGPPSDFDALAWPPLVRPHYPIRFLDADMPLAPVAHIESGLLGGISVVSSTSTFSEQVVLHTAVVTANDEKLVSDMDALIPELFFTFAGRFVP
ncbi:MAG: hypothetical protein ACKPKO_47915, partial [Candidatus Fonsibacter sp.]